jgi:hypothetical protein
MPIGPGGGSEAARLFFSSKTPSLLNKREFLKKGEEPFNRVE